MYTNNYVAPPKPTDLTFSNKVSLDGLECHEDEDVIDDDECLEGEVQKDKFSELRVSTTTVTSVLKSSINIIDIAKYLPIDETIIRIKLVYAGGSSTIIRGLAKNSKKKKDFYNQVTFTLRLPVPEEIHENGSIIVSCKIFHNGTLHITGTHNLIEARLAANILINKLCSLKGARVISIDKNVPFLKSHDNVLFSTKGDIIGWNNEEIIYLKNEYVKLDTLVFELSEEEADEKDDERRVPVFVSFKWIANKKNIYNLDGDKIGERVLHFDKEISKRHFEVDLGYIYSGHNIVGKEKTEFVENYMELIDSCDKYRKRFLDIGALVHCYTAFPDLSNDDPRKSDTKQKLKMMTEHPKLEENNFKTHMINTFFKAPFTICRTRLHKTFIDNGLYSRFDPCSNAAVNLRFHYDLSAPANVRKQNGRCSDAHKRNCNCKDISVSCFNSGKMNITGLSTLEQGYVVYEFLKEFFIEHKEKFISV